MRDPFWESTKILLRYKAPLALALCGAGLSAACFGAGIGMVLPALVLLLGEQASVTDIVRTRIVERYDPPLSDFGTWLASVVPPDPFHAFVLVMAVVATLSVIGSAGRYLHEVITITVVQRAAMVWRSRMLRRLIRSPMVQVLQQGSADHISRVVFDTRPLTRAYNALFGRSVEQVLKGAVAIIAALWLDPLLTATALIAAPLIGVLLRRFGRRIHRAARRAMRQRGHMVGALKEALGALAVVKVHNAEGYERRRFSRINRALFRQEMKIRSVRALASPVVDTIGLLGVVAVATFAAWHVFRHGVEAERFMTVLLFLGGAANSLRPLASLNHHLNEGRAAAERLMEVLALPVEPRGGTGPDTPTLERHQQSIRIADVVFAYPGQSRPALDHVDLSVEHGRTVALVGGNGSGKSTLLHLLPRLLEPCGGAVFVDGIDIAGVRLSSLRRQVAVVTQQTVLFQGTIAENIAYGRRHVPRAQIVMAARTAFADEFVSALPNGYDTVLSEHGEGLSGGQRQRLCIARAVLRDPAILILDEATSQIDTDSEAKINQALHAIRRGRTLFIAAHRLSTVREADTIVVMDEGRIIDQGTHAELLQRCPAYQVLTNAQAG